MSDTDTVQDVAKDEAEGSQKSKQKPKATKQKIVEDRDEETEDQGEEEDEAQKIMKMITTVASKGFSLFLTFIKFVLGLLRGAIGCVRSALGAVFGLGIFLTFAYVVSSYVIEEVVEEDVPDFEARLKFLLRCEIWPILPVILGGYLRSISQLSFTLPIYLGWSLSSGSVQFSSNWISCFQLYIGDDQEHCIKLNEHIMACLRSILNLY